MQGLLTEASNGMSTLEINSNGHFLILFNCYHCEDSRCNLISALISSN
jgi:hypothetical protein